MTSNNSDKKNAFLNDSTDIENSNKTLPSLLMTPIFNVNSVWPSYLIKPVYDNNVNIKPLDNHYYNTVNHLANNITSYGHTTHTTPYGTQMFPVMPYYIPSTKIGENIPPVMYNL